MACEAVKKAMADAGLEPRDIDGMTSYQAGDSTSSNHVATSLGIRLNYSLDIFGGGSSTEALVGHAIGLLEAGYCKTIVIFRSMNGRSGRRSCAANSSHWRSTVLYALGMDNSRAVVRHVRHALST